MKRIVILLSLLILSVSQANAWVDPGLALEKRIKPVGQVNVTAKQTAATAATTGDAKPAAALEVSGKSIYTKHCAVCHANGIAGAPKTGDAGAWKVRMKKGVTGLLKTAISGLNAMPPKGTCASCTDAQLKAAIEFMVPKS